MRRRDVTTTTIQDDAGKQVRTALDDLQTDSAETLVIARRTDLSLFATLSASMAALSQRVEGHRLMLMEEEEQMRLLVIDEEENVRSMWLAPWADVLHQAV